MKHFISSVKLISLVLLLLSASSSYAALGVTSVSPTQNNVSVAASTTISVTFDADIDQATLTAASVIVYGSISGKHTGTISFTGTSIVNFDPDNDFIAGEIVSAILTSDIESDAADPLTNGYEWNFTIGTASTAGTLEYYE